MAQETPLDMIQGLVAEVDANIRRMKRDKNVTAQQVHDELHETVLTFIKELAMSVAQELAATQQYIQEEVEPLLAQVAGEESQLLPEDAGLLLGRLSSHRALMAQLLDKATTDGEAPDRLAAMQEEIKATDAALELVGEITLEGDPDDAGGAEEEEEEEVEQE